MSNNLDKRRLIERMDKAPNKWGGDTDEKELVFGWALILLLTLVGLAIVLIALWGRG
jgi:hypothetical protein